MAALACQGDGYVSAASSVPQYFIILPLFPSLLEWVDRTETTPESEWVSLVCVAPLTSSLGWTRQSRRRHCVSLGFFFSLCLVAKALLYGVRPGEISQNNRTLKHEKCFCPSVKGPGNPIAQVAWIENCPWSGTLGCPKFCPFNLMS